jgi:hypothetical protein
MGSWPHACCKISFFTSYFTYRYLSIQLLRTGLFTKGLVAGTENRADKIRLVAHHARSIGPTSTAYQWSIQI